MVYRHRMCRNTYATYSFSKQHNCDIGLYSSLTNNKLLSNLLFRLDIGSYRCLSLLHQWKYLQRRHSRTISTKLQSVDPEWICFWINYFMTLIKTVILSPHTGVTMHNIVEIAESMKYSVHWLTACLTACYFIIKITV